MPLLSRSAIDTASDIATEDVRCPEWGGSVRVRALTAKERNRMIARMRESTTDDSDAGYQVALVAACAVDESGGLLYPTAADHEALGRKNARVVERIFTAAAKLNRMRPGDEEELEKNSEATTSGRTGSSSPSTSAE